MELAQDMKSRNQQEQQQQQKQQQQKQQKQKQQQQQLQQSQQLKKEQQPFKALKSQQIRKDYSPVIPIDHQRKRTPNPLQSIDRKARRLTMASPPSQRIHYPQRQTVTSPVPQSALNRNDSSPISTRQLPKYSNVSPTRSNNISQLAQQKYSPSRSTATSISIANKSPIKSAKKYPNSSPLSEHDLSPEKKKTLPIQQQPDRHLDVYGIPKSNTRRRFSMENNSMITITNDTTKKINPYSGMSLDAFMESRYVPRQAITTTSLKTSSNMTTPLTPPSTATMTKSANLSRTLSNDLQQRIRVCVRKRPLSRKEVNHGELDIAQLVGAHTIQLNAPKTRVDLTRYTEQHSFTFDEAFNSGSSNIEIYNRTARPLVNYIFNGGKATCFAYGQTGSGKTYTMLDPEHGLYIMAAKDIFEMLEDPDYNHLSASIGFYEIYQGKLYDLLNKRKQLIPRDDGNSNVVITGLLEYPISDLDRLLQIFDFGSQSRTTGKTGANDNSSRSHAVLQVLLKNKKTNGIHGKLSFIDLAGSERGADRGDANIKTRLEGGEINKSLLALKECIRALDKDKKHTPFRGSKLTQVLRDSFVGDSRTCMIATISPNNSNSEHTLNTLRYADRVKELKGESDPRLQADLPLLDSALDGKCNKYRDDAHSETTFDEFWTEAPAENLMEVDFPVDAISNSAMGTPRSQRVWSGSSAPQLQGRNYRRLSSPSDGLVQQDKEDSLFPEHPVIRPSPNNSYTLHRQSSDHTKPTIPPSQLSAISVHTKMNSVTDISTNSAPVQQELYDAHDGLTPQHNRMNLSANLPAPPTAANDYTTTTNDSNQVSADHILGFLRLQRAQIKDNEDCIRQEKKMISKLTLTISTSHDDMTKALDQNEKMTQDYEDYLNNLKDILDRKSYCVDTFKSRVKQELGDEEDGVNGTESPP
ncbi:unnamed protein product [Absidia cylindrospora]